MDYSWLLCNSGETGTFSSLSMKVLKDNRHVELTELHVNTMGQETQSTQREGTPS